MQTQRLGPKDTTYRPEVLFSILYRVAGFEFPVVGENVDHVARTPKKSPGFTIEVSESQPGDNNYLKAVVYHAPPGGEYRQHLFLIGFRSEDRTGPRRAKRRLEELVFPWIERNER